MVNVFIPACCIVGILWAAVLWKRVSAVKVSGGTPIRGNNGEEYLLEEEQRGDAEVKPSQLP